MCSSGNSTWFKVGLYWLLMRRQGYLHHMTNGHFSDSLEIGEWDESVQCLCMSICQVCSSIFDWSFEWLGTLVVNKNVINNIFVPATLLLFWPNSFLRKLHKSLRIEYCSTHYYDLNINYCIRMRKFTHLNEDPRLTTRVLFLGSFLTAWHRKNAWCSIHFFQKHLHSFLLSKKNSTVSL